MKNIVKLDIPKNIYHISDIYMHRYNKIKKLNIHKDVVKLDYRVFYNKQHLKKVTFQKNSRLTIISEGSFEGCSNLEEINLPDNLTTIEKNAFKNCTAIKSLILPKNIISVDPDAFYGWDDTQTIYSPIDLKKPITTKANIIYMKEEVNRGNKIIRNKDGNNYYLVTVKCGHVGRHRYMPITFAVKAEDGKDAVEIVRTFPRVKRGHKDFVLNIELTDLEGYEKQIQINSNDPYLRIGSKSEQKTILDLIENRLVNEPNYQRRD